MAITILIVDDSATMLMSLKTGLSINGFKVESANSGQAALDKLKLGVKPDLILTDINMPGMTGLELIGKIRVQAALRQRSGQSDQAGSAGSVKIWQRSDLHFGGHSYCLCWHPYCLFSCEKERVVRDRKIRLRRIRIRLLDRSALGLICNLMLWFSLSAEQGHCFNEHWRHNAGIFLLFILIPGIFLMLTNWKQAKSAVSDM